MINGDTLDVEDLTDDTPRAPDVTILPPAKYLPKSVQKLMAARDAAWDKYDDMEAEYDDVIRRDWRKVAEAADKRAATEAMERGEDPFAGESHVERAERMRPRVIGALNALKSEVCRADAALRDAVRAELPAIKKAIGADMKAAADKYAQAWSTAMEARGAYGAMVNLRRWAATWEADGRMDCPADTTATPLTFTGHDVKDEYQRQRYGSAEIEAIAESFRAAGHVDVYGETGEPAQQLDPKVTIRSTRNGIEMRIKASHAYAQVQRGDAEYVNPDEVPDEFRNPEPLMAYDPVAKVYRLVPTE